MKGHHDHLELVEICVKYLAFHKLWNPKVTCTREILSFPGQPITEMMEKLKLEFGSWNLKFKI